jgi:hypothetical protein
MIIYSVVFDVQYVRLTCHQHSTNITFTVAEHIIVQNENDVLSLTAVIMRATLS